ncbi:MAG: transketolase [bacterium]|nr:transketolase [bacterium]
MSCVNFESAKLSAEEIAAMQEFAREARGDVLKMTTLATCGHPGGSMSSMEMYTLLWHCAKVDPGNPGWEERDRIVVSHGHTSPGVYAVLGRRGFFPIEEALAHFRQIGSCFAGHVERCVPGVEWDTGNLGQGLSAAVGFALAREVRGMKYRVFCVMGDGEQQKGQISEARRVAVKYRLRDLIALVDLNGLQINGDTREVMPQNVQKNWASDGWHTIVVDGHDLQALYKAVRKGLAKGEPTVIIAKTVMGKGVSFMENEAHYHGAALTEEQCRAALKELGVEDNLEQLKVRRGQRQTMLMEAYQPQVQPVRLSVGVPRTYGASDGLDNRSAWGNAIADIAKANEGDATATPVVVLDCDLKPSVKTGGFEKVAPGRFFQCGIQEHNTATMAGAMSASGLQVFFADFGVFGVDETYNQHRLSVLNHVAPKIVCTHCGLDVGEDGKTHQCVDYVGVFRNLLGVEVIVPADPNQTDRAVRYAAQSRKMTLIAMGRSKAPVICGEDGKPVFGGEYEFRYGVADVIRAGDDAAIVVMGTLCANAVGAHEELRKKGIRARVVHVATPLALDEEVMRGAAGTGVIVTVEDHVVTSGLGVSVAEFLAQRGLVCRFKKLGVTRYASSGTPKALFAEYGLDAAGIARAVEEMIV